MLVSLTSELLPQETHPIYPPILECGIRVVRIGYFTAVTRLFPRRDSGGARSRSMLVPRRIAAWVLRFCPQRSVGRYAVEPKLAGHSPVSRRRPRIFDAAWRMACVQVSGGGSHVASASSPCQVRVSRTGMPLGLLTS